MSFHFWPTCHWNKFLEVGLLQQKGNALVILSHSPASGLYHSAFQHCMRFLISPQFHEENMLPNVWIFANLIKQKSFILHLFYQEWDWTSFYMFKSSLHFCPYEIRVNIFSLFFYRVVSPLLCRFSYIKVVSLCLWFNLQRVFIVILFYLMMLFCCTKVIFLNVIKFIILSPYCF